MSEPATDATGAIYVVGTFQGAASVSGTALEADAERSLALFKLDATGGLSWARAVAGEFIGPQIAVQPDGRAVVAGVFDDEVDFGDGPLFGLTFQYFVAHYDAVGAVLWARALSGPGVDACGESRSPTMGACMSAARSPIRRVWLVGHSSPSVAATSWSLDSRPAESSSAS